MSMEQLAAALVPEVSITTVAKLETRRMGLTLDYIMKIADILGCSPGDIIGASPIRSIPLLGSIAAGPWNDAEQEHIGYVPLPNGIGGPRCFALRPVGDSMDQIVPPGDGGYIVVDPDQLDLRDGSLYAVQRDGGEATFKMYRSDPARLEPCSTNSDYAPIMIGREPFFVVGRVIYTGHIL